MSQAALTLRPPPNIDFVQGYPGIPPGAPDRPQAAVKGAIEVRVGPQGVKAKWVRIELRKIETLPNGGVQNTFFDFVGQSPVNLWQASEDYDTLDTQDFPFYIRIPESIPPTLALENRAGIKYELIATVCVKGKKGFLRRDKPAVLATSAPIVIDKHELHSTWPVYAQQATREISHDGVTLIAEHSHSCFGPGDTISLFATVKSDALQAVILRGFEFVLRETTVFRAGPHTTGKKGQPQVKVVHVGEQKKPVNATLYRNMSRKVELTVHVPSRHTSATLNSARHIDITYALIVKAVMGTDNPLVLDIPVIISNWPRNVSVEAIRRIGMAPNVSLTAAGGHTPIPTITAHHISQTINIGNPIVPLPPVAAPTSRHPYSAPDVTSKPSTTATESSSDLMSRGPYNTAPTRSNVYTNRTDEFGMSDRDGDDRRDNLVTQTIGVAPPSSESGSARPRGSSMRGQANNRFTVTNYHSDDIIEDNEQPSRGISQSSSGANGSAMLSSPETPPSTAKTTVSNFSGWKTAEEEKQQLYERAKANVERMQGEVARAPSVTSQVTSNNTPHLDAGPVVSPKNNASSSKPARKWITAEEEKTRLFNEAQAAAQKHHEFANDASHSRNASLTASISGATGVAHYPKAVSSASRTPPPVAGGSSMPANGSTVIKAPTPQYPSAEQEKAALRRYHEAKAAVDRTQYEAFDSPPVAPAPLAPIAYDAPYAVSPPRTGASPPLFNYSPPTSSPQASALSEKERLRRAFEARDAAAAAAMLPPVPMDTAHYSPPPTVMAAAPSSALAEKEMLRRKFEAQDAVAGPPTPPAPRVNGLAHSVSAGSTRPPPVPPAVSGSRPLTAAEEKARLRTLFEQNDLARVSKPMPTPAPMPAPLVNGGSMRMPSPPNFLTGIPPPPPLMPKPPKEYIEETREEDHRTYAQLEAIDKEGIAKVVPDIVTFQDGLLDINGNSVPIPGPPPPLPPKPLDDML